MSQHTDTPSNTSLRPPVPHIHTFGIKLASVRNFGSFFALPPCQGAQWATSTCSIFNSLAVQRFLHCYISPGSTQGTGAAALLGNGHGVRAFLWVCHGCSDLNQTPQAIPQLTNKTTNVIFQSQARHTCLLPDQHRRDLAGCPFPSRSPAAWHGGRGTSGSRGGHSPLPAPAHGGWELLRAPAQGWPRCQGSPQPLSYPEGGNAAPGPQQRISPTQRSREPQLRAGEKHGLGREGVRGGISLRESSVNP